MAKKGETGPLAGSIIVVFIILFGGFYVLTHRPSRSDITPSQIIAAPDPVLEATRAPQSTSTTPSSIQEDFARIQPAGIDADLDSFSLELK